MKKQEWVENMILKIYLLKVIENLLKKKSKSLLEKTEIAERVKLTRQKKKKNC